MFQALEHKLSKRFGNFFQGAQQIYFKSHLFEMNTGGTPGVGIPLPDHSVRAEAGRLLPADGYSCAKSVWIIAILGVSYSSYQRYNDCPLGS